MPSKIKDVKRVTQVVKTLLKHGFGRIIYEHGLKKHLPFYKKTFIQKKLPSALPLKLKQVFEELGGAYIKLGQLLSLRSDLIPQEYCEEFKELRDEVPPFPFEQVLKIIKQELGDIFIEIQEKPLGSASIAQVHKAKLKNNKWVVIKIQRPFVKEEFETDIDIMYYIARKLEKKFKDFSPIEIVKEFEEYTKKELDFKHEARSIDRFYHIFYKDPNIKIPKVYWQYTTKNVLVMEYLRGKKINELKNEHYNKRKIAELLIKTVVKQVYEHGIFHADLHPGNVLVIKNDKIALLDFGIIGYLSSDMRKKGLELFVSLINHDSEEIIKILLKIGKAGKETNLQKFKEEIEEILDEWYDNNLKTTQITRVLYLLINTCIKHKVKMPVDIILYVKSFLTVEGTCKELVPDFNFITVAQPFMIKLLENQNTPQKIINRFVKSSQNITESLMKIPVETFELIEKLKSGNFTFELDDTDIKHLGMDINMSSNRLSLAIVISALVIAGAMLADFQPQYAGYSIISIFILFFATLMMFSLIISIHREGSQKYDYHRKF